MDQETNKPFRIADIPDDQLEALYRVEQRLRDETHRPLVLIAYEPEDSAR